MTNLEGKIAVVTGASSGLGKEIAIQLNSLGVKVIALARSIEKADLPQEITKVPLNIRDLNSIDEAFESIDARTNQIDILINCAGRGLVKNLEDTSREEIMDVLGINLKGAIYISQEVYKRMLRSGSGHIVNVSSKLGRPNCNDVCYHYDMTITIPSSDKRQVIDITEKITREVVDFSGVVSVFVQHTTAAITTADLDPGTDLDLLDALEGLLPNRQWRHPHNPEHAPDHLLASIIGPGVVIPVNAGRLQLGMWQRVVLVEFNGPQERVIEITLIGSQHTDASLVL